MDASFFPSNSLIKSVEILPSARAILPIISYIGRRSRLYHQSTKINRLSYVPCCQVGSKSPSPEEDEQKKPLQAEVDWRSFRARLVAKEKTTSAIVDLDTVLNQQPSSTTTSSASAAAIGDDNNKWAHTIHEPEKGCLLIATEKLDGVHIFEKTVVLLLSTGQVGPVGLILNRPSLMSIKETRSSSFDVAGAFSDRPLFFGGPLEDGLFLVNPKKEDEWVGKTGVFDEIMKGFYFGSKESIGCAAEMVKRKALEVGDFRFFDGYCAWEKVQLRDEIRAGYWTVAACSPSVIGFSGVGGVGLWEEVLGLMGPKKSLVITIGSYLIFVTSLTLLCGLNLA